MHEILRKEFGDDRVHLSGNFDVPFSATIKDILEKKQKHGYIIVEISSFMAYNIKRYLSNYSIFTNFETDHLNWHPDMKDYFSSKWKVFENTKKTCIIHTSIETRFKEYNISAALPGRKIRYYGVEKTSLNEKDFVKLPDIIVS